MGDSSTVVGVGDLGWLVLSSQIMVAGDDRGVRLP